MNSKNPLNIFDLHDEKDFNQACIKAFLHQYKNIPIYRQYVDLLKIKPYSIAHYTAIPFLPIQFFKSHNIIEAAKEQQVIFSSSGTTGAQTSRHLIADIDLYMESYRAAFQLFYGKVKEIAILALLPSYLERQGSSLIFMLDDLIKQSEQPESGYFLYNHEDLYERLHKLKSKGTKTILFGVTYALLDFAETHSIDFPELILMETGGMKGRRKEMIREEVHAVLTKAFAVEKIHSEYGMTELLSQGYSAGDGIFRTPPWMKILLRDTSDPLSLLRTGASSGAINVIDLANYHSCSFIATQDLGKCLQDGSFEVLGRFDHADIRGCNLLIV